MTRSEVYWATARGRTIETGMVAGTIHLFDEYLSGVIDNGDVVAVKIHPGEWLNPYYIRPMFVRAVVDRIKAFGGKPFVTETTCAPYIPYGGRFTARDLLETMARSGFTAETMGCPIIVADGPRGLDDVPVKIDGHILLEQYVAKAIAEADAMIVLTHFKGHRITVVGGAIKQVGVGIPSKRGKFNLHMTLHPKYGVSASEVHPERCEGKKCPQWILCAECPFEAIEITETGMKFDPSRCTGCFMHLWHTFRCKVFIQPDNWMVASTLGMVDSAAAVLKCFDKGKIGYLNFVIDVSPYCDCIAFADNPIVPNIGVFASKDIVAIDSACLDAVTSSRGLIDSAAEEQDALAPGVEKFMPVFPLPYYEKSMIEEGKGIPPEIRENWARLFTIAAEQLGIGTSNYNLELVVPKRNDPEFLKKIYFRGVPTAKRYTPAKIEPIIPPEGFKRRDEIDWDKLIKAIKERETK